MKKAALITGANRGLGLALAEVFRPHYGLVLHSRRRDEDLMARFPDAAFLVGDLTEPVNFLQWAAKLEDSSLAVLVNNAGAYLRRGIVELTDREVLSAVEANLVAPIRMTRLAWPLLEKGAVVVNVSSLAAGSPGWGEAVYAATKGGLSAFSEALQYEATARGVRVVDVRLGAMKTDMSSGRDSWPDFIEPVEAADTILSLCRGYASLRVTSVEIKRRRY